MYGRAIADRNGGTVCAPDGGLHAWTVYFAAPAGASITHAHAVLQGQNSNGTFSDIGCNTANY